MPPSDRQEIPSFGSKQLKLPDELRGPLKAHLSDLLEQYKELNWAGRVGFGRRPALIVIDLALKWTKPDCYPLGSSVDSVVEATVSLLDCARRAEIPIFFTTYDYDPADPPSPHHRKAGQVHRQAMDEGEFDLDARLERRPTERIVRKKYASALKDTNLIQNLASLGVDTLIVTGVSTSHCIYATCRDAAHTFHVIVPREAVGDRCEIMHEVNLLDIDIDLGDVVGAREVCDYLDALND